MITPKEELSMNRKTAINLLLSAGLVAGSGMTLAAESETDMQKQAAAEKALAITALENMSEYLRSLDKFTVHAQVNIDEVLANGQKVQLIKSVEVTADPPSNLMVKSSTKYSERDFYFDGKTFTLYTPKLGVYASFDTSATIGEVVAKAADEYGVEMPLADLFYWGTESDDASAIDEAMIVGVGKIDGVSCNHFAFRQKEIDWQICIQRGDTPLPLKLVITSKEEAAQPQHVSVMKWDTAPSLTGQSYTFMPHDGDSKINFGKVDSDK
jgi:hypothetical protein